MNNQSQEVSKPVCADDSCGEPLVVKKKSAEDFNLRPEKGPIETFLLRLVWVVFFLCWGLFFFLQSKNGQPAWREDTLQTLKTSLNWMILCSHSGAKELIDFLATHLISAMIPAFFLAAAISTFFSKETIILAMGRKTNPFISYPIAAFAGAILTVCSCGVLPIFMSILQSGAGLGPAITFLYASPAINLISIIYTWKILTPMLWIRIFGVAFCAVLIGLIMQRLFRDADLEFEHEEPTPKKRGRQPWQEGAFFLVLLSIMLTSTDALAFLSSRIIPTSFFAHQGPELAVKSAGLAGKLTMILAEIILTVLILRAWFTWDEARKWLKRTYRQGRRIIPMVFLGIFFSGFLGGAGSIIDRLELVSTNSIFSNIMASFIGAMLYFGSIVGVNVVDLFMRWGMHKGPALALLLAGPSISLPSVLALLPIIGHKKSMCFLILVVIFSASLGLLYGSL